MTSDPHSLSNLRDIVSPEPPSFWPPAPGVWVVVGIVVVAALVLCWRLYSGRKRNAYRRAGLTLLQDAGTLHDISVVLKRVALAAFPRDQVASLYGQEWVSFLNQTCSRCDFSALLTAPPESKDLSILAELSRRWICKHTTSIPEPTGSGEN